MAGANPGHLPFKNIFSFVIARLHRAIQ